MGKLLLSLKVLAMCLPFVAVQPLSCVLLFVTPWTAACQASLFFTISWSLLKLMSIESVKPTNHLILCHPLPLLPSIFPSIKVSSSVSHLFASAGQSLGASASSAVLPMNIQGWFPLGLTGLILLSKGLSRVFSSTIVWKHQFLVLNLLYGPTLISVDNYWKKTALTIRTFASKVMSDYQYL